MAVHAPCRFRFLKKLHFLFVAGLFLWAFTGATLNAFAAEEVDDENLLGLMPRIDFVTLRQNLGELYRGQKVNASFEFVNKGDGILHIRSIHAACGCVETKVEPKDRFAPGEKGQISFTFDSTFFAGEIVRTLTVDTNAPSPSAVTLTFTANVRQEIWAKPAIVSLGEVSKTFTREFSTEVFVSDRAAGKDTVPSSLEKASLDADTKKELVDAKGPIALLKVTSSSPQIQARLDQGNKSTRLTVKVLGNLPIGPFRERISIWNNSRHLKELVIPVIGEVTGHVKPSAKYLEFGVVRGQSVVRRTLTLQSDSKDFKVSDVDIEIRPTEVLKGIKEKQFIKTAFEKAKDSYIINFDMQVPSGIDSEAKSVNASGTFVVRTNDEDYKEIRVPFFGILRRE